MKLTSAQCKNAKPRWEWDGEKKVYKTYRMGDGGGLYLVCTGKGGKS